MEGDAAPGGGGLLGVPAAIVVLIYRERRHVASSRCPHVGGKRPMPYIAKAASLEKCFRLIDCHGSRFRTFKHFYS